MTAIPGCLLRAREEGGRAAMAMVLMVAGVVQGQETAPVRTVAAVNLDRYVGEWFEIARLPNRFQNKCVSDVRATYARRSDGDIDVINRCRTTDGGTTEAQGVARVVDEHTSAKLKVRFAPAMLSFLPMVWGDYWVLGLADDYSWAVVGTPDRKYLWVLSRTPDLDEVSFATVIDLARANGFAVDRLIRGNHTPGVTKPSDEAFALRHRHLGQVCTDITSWMRAVPAASSSRGRSGGRRRA